MYLEHVMGNASRSSLRCHSSRYGRILLPHPLPSSCEWSSSMSPAGPGTTMKRPEWLGILWTPMLGTRGWREFVRVLNRLVEFVGKVGCFSLRVLTDCWRPPWEIAQLFRRLAEVGNRSISLIVVSGFALGAVMTLHTRSTLVSF